tara:strand:- start:1061 stop:1759 length:699 start_codon:yes stop_codon:yes gene_type:complete
MPVGIGGEATWVCPTISGNVAAVDISGNSVAFTQLAAVTVVADTGSGGSYAFDFPKLTGNLVHTTAGVTSIKSLSQWVKLDSNAYSRIWSTRNNTVIGYLNNGPFATYYSGVSHDGSVTRSISTWYHLVDMFDGATWTRYVDGVQTQTAVQTATWLTGSILYYGGKSGDASGDRYDGQMDDMRTFDRVITQAEITHLATARGVLGGPGGSDGYNAFTSAIYNPRNYNNTRFG